MARLNLLYLYAYGRSNWNENEIRYSLRSMSDTNDVDWVGITGPAVPPFLKDIVHIQADAGPKKFASLLHQLRIAFTDERVPEDLILMNDDFFMRPTPPWDWTPTHLGPVPTKPRNTWHRSIMITAEWLKTLGIKDCLNYEGHTPMPIKKSLARETLARMPEGQLMQLRTAYGNMHNIGGNLHTNAKHKLLAHWPASSPFLSLTSHPAQELKDFITRAWPNASRWEV